LRYIELHSGKLGEIQLQYEAEEIVAVGNPATHFVACDQYGFTAFDAKSKQVRWRKSLPYAIRDYNIQPHPKGWLLTFGGTEDLHVLDPGNGDVKSSI
jgi:hypothetical protein